MSDTARRARFDAQRQAAAKREPTPEQIRRITAALLPGKPASKLASAVTPSGWEWHAYTGWMTEGRVHVSASRHGVHLAEEVEDLAAAMRWVEGLTA